MKINIDGNVVKEDNLGQRAKRICEVVASIAIEFTITNFHDTEMVILTMEGFYKYLWLKSHSSDIISYESVHAICERMV